MQDLTNIDVTEARDLALIQKKGFQIGPRANAKVGDVVWRQFISERLKAKVM